MTTTEPRLGQVGLNRQCMIVSGKRLVVTSQVGQEMTEPCSGQGRLECYCPIESCKGFVITLELDERVALTEPRLSEIGLQRQRLAKKRCSLTRPAAAHRLYSVLECLFGRAHN